MGRYLDNKRDMEEAIKKYSQLPANRRLKIAAIGFGILAVTLLLVMLIWFDQLSWHAMHVIRGCVGLCAIIFALLATIFLYRVYSAYWRERNRG